MFSTFAVSKGSQISENKEVSSVNSFTLVFKLSLRSLMHIRKNNGHNIEPCGTPAWIVSQSDVWPLSKTLWNLPLRKLLITWNKFPLTPFCFNLKNNNLSCQTLSNAMDMPRNTNLKKYHEWFQVVDKYMNHPGENPIDI